MIRAALLVSGTTLLHAATGAACGPDCSIPSLLTDNSELRSIATRSSSARSPGRSPSPRSAATASKLRMICSVVFETAISRSHFANHPFPD
jgi:hypothetical protein